MFYELLDEIYRRETEAIRTSRKVLPLEERDDLEVRYSFGTERPVYLFGVKDNYQARLATISCLAFQKEKLKFTSVIVHEDFEVLTSKDSCSYMPSRTTVLVPIVLIALILTKKLAGRPEGPS